MTYRAREGIVAETLRSALEPRVYSKSSYLGKVTRGRYGSEYDEESTHFHVLQFLRLALEGGGNVWHDKLGPD